MKVSIVGAGYVGLVTGLCLAEKGHQVTCIEVDQSRLDALRAGRPPIFEPKLESMLARYMGNRFLVTSDLESAVHLTELTMIAVGTPFDGRQIDLQYVKEASRQIGSALAGKSDYHVVIVKSTVVPGTTDEVVLPILEDASGKGAGSDFGLGMNPEFLSEGTAVEDFLQPDRIVIGGIDKRTRQHIVRLYREFGNVPLIETNNKTAELIKYASNSLLATLISFSNEIGNLCSALGDVDVVEVMAGVHLSQYLSTPQPNGTRHIASIASFLGAGCGFGGSCLPKDVAALLSHGQEHGQAMPLLESVLAINRQQPGRMLELLKRHHRNLKDVRVTVLGLAFKPDTDDVRESPSLPIIRALVDEGSQVSAYDPVANASFARAAGPLPIRYCTSLDESIANADAILIATHWSEFERLPSLLGDREERVIVVDGRRMLDPRAVQLYEGIGRTSSSSERVAGCHSETGEVA